MLVVHLFTSYAHVNLCHVFSSSWCRGLAAASACGSSWTFLFTFQLPPNFMFKNTVTCYIVDLFSQLSHLLVLCLYSCLHKNIQKAVQVNKPIAVWLT